MSATQLNDQITLPRDPSASAEAATKNYVDNAIAGTAQLAGATFSGGVAVSSSSVNSPWLETVSSSGVTYLDRTGTLSRFRSSGGLSLTLDDTAGGAQFAGGPVYQFNDNTYSLGKSNRRWSVVYAGTGTINTSDARDKTPVAALSEAELAAAKALAVEIGTYRFLDSITAKGADAARHHCGMTVQRAVAIMQANGLDPMRYGFICHDVWAEQQEVWSDPQPEVLDENGKVIQPARPAELLTPYLAAGDRYSFRPDELLLFIARGFDARLTALEAQSA